MAILSSFVSLFLCREHLAWQRRHHDVDHHQHQPPSRRPGFRCHAETAPRRRLVLCVSEPADEWSRDTAMLLDSTSRRSRYRLLPPMRPPPSPPPPPVPPRAPGRQRPAQRSTRANLPQQQQQLDRGALYGVMACIGQRLVNTTYAVSGYAAMVYYGLDYTPSEVSVLLQAERKTVTERWIQSLGMTSVPGYNSTFDMEMPTGRVARIHITFTGDSNWERSTRRAGTTHTSILTLPGIVDQLALRYTESLAACPASAAAPPQAEAFADAMRWVLRRIPEMHQSEHRLRYDRVQHVLARKFWDPFTLSFPDCVDLFSEAGLGDVESHLRRAKASRPTHGKRVHFEYASARREPASSRQEAASSFSTGIPDPRPPAINDELKPPRKPPPSSHVEAMVSSLRSHQLRTECALNAGLSWLPPEFAHQTSSAPRLTCTSQAAAWRDNHARPGSVSLGATGVTPGLSWGAQPSAGGRRAPPSSSAHSPNGYPMGTACRETGLDTLQFERRIVLPFQDWS
ncbi:hypothetical protein B0I35DRAFT_422709 [Stachybotrys elegans]|uniref:Uncharacterized protein n=1 Tax=Stachybotrys elegans TaxID=80388 RepID=A0A8K0SYP7_9HYPO|nr:hypothetical protein B0I35DRAFT_422709 [Stachybotrys elegans]